MDIGEKAGCFELARIQRELRLFQRNILMSVTPGLILRIIKTKNAIMTL